jgi:manganese/zinc/iron transport system permease protein
MVIGAIVTDAWLNVQHQAAATLIAFVGAVVSSFIAVRIIRFLTSRRLASSDAALTFVLSASFAVALFLISAVQSVYPALWRRLQTLLMGQAATMRDQYAVMVVLWILFGLGLFMVFERSLKTSLFDPDFARLSRLTNWFIERLFMVLLVMTIIISIRSMGVVLLSAMLIIPAVVARLLTSTFETMVVIAAAVGGACGLSGVVLSHTCALFMTASSGHCLWLPTGPLIALLLTMCFSCALCFSPSEGIVVKAWRRRTFVRRCQRENMLKEMYKECVRSGVLTCPAHYLRELLPASPLTLRSLLGCLQRRGYVIVSSDGAATMTEQGMAAGRKLVRLHRLWELYLVECCGMPKDRVHPKAEEMEHILTPEVERKLSVLLHNPANDPHEQPIPAYEGEVF